MNKENLLYSKAVFGEEERQAVNRVIVNEWLSGGLETQRFEKGLAEWWGVKHSVAVNSGSSANFVALQALNLEKGSEVITTAGGAFPTTVSPIVYHGLVPVFVDVDRLNISPVEIEKAITDKTKAIMFAHTLGFPADIERIMEVANLHGLRVIEDCADSMGSTVGGKKLGTFGDIATVSFYPAHTMTTGGEGGAVLTNDSKLFREAFSIRDWGRDCVCQVGGKVPACGDRHSNPPFDHRYYYTRLGLNFKLTEMQAAFGNEQLSRVDGFIELRRRNYKILADELGVEVDGEVAPFAFPILHPKKEEAMEYLEKNGIQTRTLFGGNILEHPAYKDIPHRTIGNLSESDRLLQEAFFVGVGPHLTKDNMLFIANKLKEVS